MRGIIEEWKDIKGYEGLYKISNTGKVKSVSNRKCVHGIKTMSKADIEINPYDNGNGYLVVCLCNYGKRKKYFIHRLVAEHFLENPNNEKVVNHKDYDITNNVYTNLEWCSQKENIRHSISNMRKQHNSKTATGERYITYRKKQELYRVSIKVANVDRSFKTLADAIVFRNEVLNEINYTI